MYSCISSGILLHQQADHMCSLRCCVSESDSRDTALAALFAAEQAMTNYPMTDLMSTVKFVEPGMTLLAPGHTEIAPTVHTRLGSRLGLILGSTLGSKANCAAPLSFSKACSLSSRRPPLHCCSMVYMASAAAAKGSRLIAMGTVPACPCGARQRKLSQELNCLSYAACL